MCALSWGDCCVCFHGAWAGDSFASMLGWAQVAEPSGFDCSLFKTQDRPRFFASRIDRFNSPDAHYRYYPVLRGFSSVLGTAPCCGRQHITVPHVHLVTSSLWRLSCLRVVTCELSAERIEFKVGVYAPYSFSVDGIDASEWCCYWFCS